VDKLDLTQPIKAHHRDGRVVEASAMPNGNVTWRDGNLHHCAIGTDGPLDTECGDWTLRNVIRAKPSTPSNEELTQRMEIAPEVQARMEKLVRRIAGGWHMHAVNDDGITMYEAFDEARSIVSDLPKPVDPIDPDEEAAVDLADKHQCVGGIELALEAIKLGRTLAAGGTAHE